MTSLMPIPVVEVPTVVHHVEIIPADNPDTWNYWIPRWTAGHAVRTRTAYLKVISAFLQFIDYKPVSALETLDIEAYQESLSGLAKRTIGMRVAAVCSLVTFIHRRNLRILPQNVGAVVRRVKISTDLTARALSEEDVLRIISSESVPWKAALLRLFYGTGIRSEELVRIQRKHVTELDGDSARIVIHGKGDKVRTVIAYKGAWSALSSILPEDPEAFVFCGKRGQRMHPVYASFIVTRAAEKAGLGKRVSGHWMRHAFCSHTLDRGAPVHEVSADMGHASLATTGRYAHANKKHGSGRYLAI